MKRTVATGLVCACAVTAASGMLAAPGQTTARPGEPTQARVFIENRGINEAIPVSLEHLGEIDRPIRVEVWGIPSVTVAPNTTVRVEHARQLWDYRMLTLASGAAAESALKQAGSEGWEAVGLQTSPTGLIAVLKRPR
jgi:hypothetical protein